MSHIGTINNSGHDGYYEYPSGNFSQYDASALIQSSGINISNAFYLFTLDEPINSAVGISGAELHFAVIQTDVAQYRIIADATPNPLPPSSVIDANDRTRTTNFIFHEFSGTTEFHIDAQSIVQEVYDNLSDGDNLESILFFVEYASGTGIELRTYETIVDDDWPGAHMHVDSINETDVSFKIFKNRNQTNGSVVVGVNQFGNTYTLNTDYQDSISVNKLYNNYNNRFDDVNYYAN